MARTKKNNQIPAFITVDNREYKLIDIDKSETGRVTTKGFSIKELYERYTKMTIIRDILMQRTENQWVKMQKCELIISVIYERDIGKLLMTGKGCTDDSSYEQHSLLDGLQRLSTLCDYIDNKFALAKRMKPIPCRFKNESGTVITRHIDISGLKFNQLPTLLQSRILDYRIDVDIYNGYTDEELDKIVFCVNNGTRFKPMQKIRTVLKSSSMKYIQPVCDSTLWEEVKNCKDINDTILGCVVRTLMLFTDYKFKQLSTSEMTKFADDFSQKSEPTIEQTVSGVSALVEQLADVTFNLSDKENEILLTACNIPHLIMNLDHFNSCNSIKEPSNDNYVNFIRHFLKSDAYIKYSTYCKKTASGGVLYSAKNAEMRQSILDEALDDYMIENEFIGGTNDEEYIDNFIIAKTDEEELFNAAETGCSDDEEDKDDEFNCPGTGINETGSIQLNVNGNNTGEYERVSVDRYKEVFESGESYGILSEDTRAG